MMIYEYGISKTDLCKKVKNLLMEKVLNFLKVKF